MGTYSFFLTTRNNAENCKIDWESMNEECLFGFKAFERRYKIATNLEEVAKSLDESKLFGYFTYDLKSALYEFNAHLIPESKAHPPQIFFTWEGDDEVLGLEFHPDKGRIYILGFDYGLFDNKSKTILKTTPELSGWYKQKL